MVGVTGGTLRVDSLEILEARWFTPDTLPEGLQESHRPLIRPVTVRDGQA
ncbi:hypothetical protein AB0M95_15300 [Sphaerisporangium sp. NPDC051017]